MFHSRRRINRIARIGFGRGTSFLAGWMEWFASSASLMFLFLFFLVNFCVIKIRLNMTDELEYGYLTPLFPLVPLLAISVQVVLVAELRQLHDSALNSYSSRGREPTIPALMERFL